MLKLVFVGFLLFILRFNVALSQEGNYKLKWQQNGHISYEIDKEIVTKYYLSFEGMTLSGDFLPYYSKTFRLRDNSRIFKLTDITYEPIPDSLLSTADLPAIIKQVKPHIGVYGEARKNYYLDVRFCAIRINTSTNRYERVAKFTISSKSVNKQPGDKALKSASSSLLASGYWYKIKVDKSGIYKLSYSDIVAMGISNPANFRIFGYGGKQLSYRVSDRRPSDMAEIPFYMHKGSDNAFNEGDYVLFYASGPVWWEYNEESGMFKQHIHSYSDYISYFVTGSHGTGRTISTVDNRDLEYNVTVTSYDGYDYYEEELYNLIGSGRNWYSHKVDSDIFTQDFSFSDIITGSAVKVEAAIAGRSVNTRSAILYINNSAVQSKSFQTVLTDYSWRNYAYSNQFNYTFNAVANNFGVGMAYGIGDLSDISYLDYFTVNVRNQLKYNDKELYFHDINSMGEGSIARFQIQDVSGSYQVWDISDINNIFSVRGETSETVFSFKASVDTLHEYVIFNTDYDFPRPIIDDSERGVGEVPNQNIRGMQVKHYLIITPDEFIEQAERLADFHRNHNDLNVAVVPLEKVYNEFSSGTPDATAIRDFFRHQYLKGSGQNCFKYALLFGDGSYDNRSISDGNTNYIPTYQSANSLQPVHSYVSDDYFGLLDDGEGDYNGGLLGKLDIGIGRLPVKLNDGSDQEAEDVVDKIINYHSAPFTDWRRRICYVGDDGYDPGGFSEGARHMEDANSFAQYVQSEYPGFEHKKIFLDAYPQVNTSIGQQYPQAKEALDAEFDRGVLMFIYAGHGSENYLSGERMVSKQGVISMDNSEKLPLFITATCQFSRFDHVENEGTDPSGIAAKTSAGEHALLNPNGGAIGLLTTTRVVSSGQNQQLVLYVMENIFKRDLYGKPYRLGEVIQMAKNQLGDNNKLNFTLLGDPAMRLNYPEYLVMTDSINNHSVKDYTDTLKAFNYTTVTGYVAGLDSVIMNNFNGVVYPNIFDKEQEITTFGNDNQTPFTYTDQVNIIYRGKATVRNGRFRFSFMMPRDINYHIDKGKISYYAENGIIDAKGEFRDVNIGGTGDDITDDYSGPVIELFMNDTLFEEGGITNSEPYIHALLYDESGINTTGIGIGHDITAIIDDEIQMPYLLNDFYEATIDDFQSGTVRYQLSDIPDGEHVLNLKAWDVFNNASEEQLGFVVKTLDGMIINELFNYPNPATEYTTFQYSHNAAGEVHDIVLDVFDLSGRLVTRFQTSNYESGFVSTPIEWNLNTNEGPPLMPGVYPYRLKVTTSMGTDFIDQKLIIFR